MMRRDQKSDCGCGCCGKAPKDVLLGGKAGTTRIIGPGMTRSTFLKTLTAGALGLSTLSVLSGTARAAQDPALVRGDGDVMPEVGSKTEVVLKSIYGPQPLDTLNS